MRTTRRRLVLLACVAIAVGLFASSAGANPPFLNDNSGSGGAAFGPECAAKRKQSAEVRCYTQLLLADVLQSRNPARELPILDARTQAAGGFIAGACHGLMHAVGRAYAKRIHLTLARLQNYLPKSNDPGCSAGFGHGMIMSLGPQILKTGPRGVLRTCESLSTRMERYSCVHGLGHAYMRMYGELLRYALPMCKKLGARAAPDCAQGAFHDYWIASAGRDSTKKRPGLVTSPRVLCGSYQADFARACWYRVYIERPPAHGVSSAADIRRLCAGLAGIQRGGCVAGASLNGATANPFTLARLCGHLEGADVPNCLRAVPVEEVDSVPAQQLALIRTCAHLRGAARTGCDMWFGKTLTVVTNGRFRGRCARLAARVDRASCRRGAARSEAALVTFA